MVLKGKMESTKGQKLSKRVLSHLIALLFGVVLGRNSISYSPDLTRPLEEMERTAKSFIVEYTSEAPSDGNAVEASVGLKQEDSTTTSTATANVNDETSGTTGEATATEQATNDQEPSISINNKAADVSVDTGLTTTRNDEVEVTATDTQDSITAETTTSSDAVVRQVDCSAVDRIEPVNIGFMDSPRNSPKYVVSFSWWDRRLKDPNFKLNKSLKGNPSVHRIQKLILDTPGAYVDVGANVGFMTNFAYNQHRHVYGVDPISYDIAKLCEGLAANTEKGWTNSSFFHLYHAAAGPAFSENITITRPADSEGFFDQSSLSRDNIKKQNVTEEHIPMITVDSIVPEYVSVAVVKIDVQGHEYGVIKGMEGLLSRPNRPVHVFYEDEPTLTQRAGYKPGAAEELLRSFGYDCTHFGGDTLCSKLDDSSTALTPKRDEKALPTDKAAIVATAGEETASQDSIGAPETTSQGSTAAVVRQVDCSTVDRREPVKIGRMASPINTHYLVSLSWWDVRLKNKPNFRDGSTVRANPSVHKIQDLILETPGAYVDVGANVGFMVNFAYSQNRHVFGVDPISYNIAKLCEGLAANLEKGWTNSSYLHLYHAAAGPAFQANVTITRPADSVGYFDQSSLTRGNIRKKQVTEERIPMIMVDLIVPEDVPVGVVKIDVQGHEYGVLKGMEGLLGRPKNHPVHVFYEDAASLTEQAGYTPGACTELLQSFGYNCTRLGGDTLCTKV